jgi:hypothetical protein
VAAQALGHGGELVGWQTARRVEVIRLTEILARPAGGAKDCHEKRGRQASGDAVDPAGHVPRRWREAALPRNPKNLGAFVVSAAGHIAPLNVSLPVGGAPGLAAFAAVPARRTAVIDGFVAAFIASAALMVVTAIVALAVFRDDGRGQEVDVVALQRAEMG